MRERTANLLWGIILIAIGVLLGGKAAGLFDFSFIFPGWWTLFIIIPCFIAIVRNGIGVFSTFGLLIGVALLLKENGIMEGEMIEKLLLPTVFILIGLSILWNVLFEAGKKKYAGNAQYSATFAGNKVRMQPGEKFSGCAADAVFGGMEIDLVDAEIEDGAIIDASAIFGGIQIAVPKNVKVKLHRTSIFGGSKNKTGMSNEGPVLHVNALAMFGGVEIR